MTQSIGHRLYEMFLENQRGVVYQRTQWKSLLESDRQCCEHAATELLRGVLTGEIPMPDELGPAAVQFIKNQELDEYRNFQAWMDEDAQAKRLQEKYGTRVSIEGITQASKHPAWDVDHIRDVTK